MNKIICEVCGTAYPDTANQCPICGCTKPANPQTQSSQTEEEAESGYVYVKGGRFSNSNVRKRNHMAKAAAVYEEDDPEEETPKNTNRGLTIAILILLLAIVAVAIYIYIRFFIPVGSGKDKATPTKPAATTTVMATTPEATDPPTTTPEATDPPVTTPEPTDTTPDLSCTGISVTDQKIVFDSLGAFWKIGVTVEPANTTDTLVFTSGDTKVATVDNTGKVVAVGEGSTTITVACGSVSTQFTVSVEVAKKDSTLKFNTFDPFSGMLKVDEYFQLKLRDSQKNVMEVTNWTSSKPDVATVSKNGLVHAVAPGTTTISCTYKGFVYECKIIVEAKDETDTGTEGSTGTGTGTEGGTGSGTEGGAGSGTEGGTGSGTESGTEGGTEGGTGTGTESGSGTETAAESGSNTETETE